MAKLLTLLVIAGSITTAQAQTCQSVFGAKLKVTNPICFTNEHCKQEIAEIQNCLPEDYVSEVSPEDTAKKAIAKLNKKIAQNNASDKEQKRLASLPGVRIGMTTEQVLKETAWGKPDRINKTTTAYGTNQQWVYNVRIAGYLYFTNGVLTSFQN